MTTSSTPSRPQLRRVLRLRRRALSRSQQRVAARNLYRQLAQSPQFRRARHIALYLPNDGEIDPRPLLAAAQKRGKHIYLPVLSAWPRTKMVFQRVSRHEKLAGNRFRILEPRPQPKRQRKVWALDLVLLPLVGFDDRGGRLGMGAASTTAAWPICTGARIGTCRRCWAWRMNVSAWTNWRWPAGTCPCRQR